jgi:hypothetical protein
MFQLALLLHNFDKTLWPKCHIQWLYLAAHGCKTYLNLNLTHLFQAQLARPRLICTADMRTLLRHR